jgi:kynurenine formamidase
MRAGIVTRGILYDIPRLRGTDHVTLDDPIHSWDLIDAAASQNVEPRPGDAVVIRGNRPGFFAQNPEYERWGAPRPGVHASALEFFHETRASMVIWDVMDASGQEEYGNRLVLPDGSSIAFPVHLIAIPHMGLALVDNAALEELAETCLRYDRYEFLVLVAPLIVPGGTGSAVNPIAVL